MPITIPPLRERKQDIPFLVEHFLAKYREDMGDRVTSVAPPALEKLMEYRWAGSVRELENVMQRAMVLAQGPAVEAKDIQLDADRRPAAPVGEGLPFVPEGMTLSSMSRS